MICLWVETEAGTASAVARFFESFGCQVIEGSGDRLRIGFPQASTEREAAAEARLYMSMRPRLRGSFRLAVATVNS